jgi:hypothetical protein
VATMKKRLMSSLLVVAGAGSKMRQAEPITSCTNSRDHRCVGMLSTASSTLYQGGLKSALDCRCQQQKWRLNVAPVGSGAWST